jgi:hypothetical protein
MGPFVLTVAHSEHIYILVPFIFIAAARLAVISHLHYNFTIISAVSAIFTEERIGGHEFLPGFIKDSTTVAMFIVSISKTLGIWSSCKRSCLAGRRQILSDK